MQLSLIDRHDQESSKFHNRIPENRKYDDISPLVPQFQFNVILTEKFSARPNRIGCVGGRSVIAISLAAL